MSASFIIFVAIHVCIFVFFIESLRRITKRAHEYPLEETPETLPFGFLRLRHVVMVYIVVYLVWILFSIWLYFVFVEPASFSLFPQGDNSDNLMLNL